MIMLTSTDKKNNFNLISDQLEKLNSNKQFEFKIIQDNEFLEKINLDFCVVSGFAVWSGYSFSVSSVLLSKLHVPNNFKLKVFTLDVDCINVENQIKYLKTRMHGYFESSFFIKANRSMNYKFNSELYPFISSVNLSLIERSKK